MKKLFSVLAVSMVLAGCGGSDGGSSGVPEARPSGSVSGTAFDGLILNGDVKVYAWNGKKGELLGSGKTDTSGEYSIDLDRVPSQPILIEVTGGRYTEEASDRNVALRSGDFLYALQDYEQGDSITTSLTFYTTIATGLAEHMARTGVSPAVATRRANDAISNLIGISIRETKPLEINNPSNATPVVTDGHLYGFATASISELTKWISLQNDHSKPVHEEYNSIKFAAAAYNDISADGLLDGRGLGGVVAQGVVRLTPEIYRNQIATNMLVMANSEANKTGLQPEAVLPLAKAYNENNGSMFAGAEITPLDALSPIITNLSHSSNEVIAGVVELSANITDTVGLEEVSLYIDGTLHAYQGAESAPTFTVDTSTLSDGAHEFEFYTKNITGGETTETLSLLVSNAGTTISEVYPEDQSTLTGVQTFSAKVADPIGINAVSFILDGAIYPLTAETAISKKFDVSNMLEGEHRLTVAATNSVGTKSESSITFIADNTAPNITWNGGDESVWKKIFNLSATVTDNVGLKKTELFINGQLIKTYTNGSIAESVDSRAYSEGKKSVLLRATDQAGNVTEVSASPLFDNTPPTISILSASGGNHWNKTVRFQAIASDAVGVARVDVLMFGKVFKTMHPDSDKEFSGSFQISRWMKGVGNISNGNYALTLIVTDQSGLKTATSTMIKVEVENPDPFYP
jgi:hypothetical protein